MRLLASAEHRGAPRNPYFGSPAPIDREAVPDAAPSLTIEPFVGHRMWSVVPGSVIGDLPGHPVLRSTTRSLLWEGPEIHAACISTRGTAGGHPEEPVPAIGCRCGIYALKHPAPPPRPWVWALGPIALSGRVLEGTLGYRAERGHILGPLRLSLGGEHPTCLKPFCRRPAGWVRIGPRLYLPRCGDHLLPEANGMVDVPLDEFLERAGAALASRYGATLEGA